MHKFDTKVQHLKYKVLREVARLAFQDKLLENITDIPKTLVPGTVPTMRCCVYKERAILSERVKLAMGGDKSNPNIIEVIDIACDECPVGGYEVTNACRGCIAHRCEDACKFGAISFDHQQKAHIDKSKCVECGQCAKFCPYSAIGHNKRPCQNSCKVNAINISDTKAAMIDNSKCTSCGACVYQCPFGAIMDKSFILDAINLIKNSSSSSNDNKCNLYALVAPSISSQFNYAKLGQVVTGIKQLGFHTVIEAALGADMVAFEESKELVEKDFLTSSCCPAFVTYIKTQFPDLVDKISHNLSPMATIAKYIKGIDESSKVIFIGPCTAKKAEFQKAEVNKYVDCVITFEELQALFDAKEISITELEEEVLDNASYFGRIFARSGGLADAVKQGLQEHKQLIESSDNVNEPTKEFYEKLCNFEYKPVSCDGIEACKIALLKASKGKLDANFIEGMACLGGCIGGAGCLTHEIKNKSEVDKYGHEAYEKNIYDAIKILK